MKLNPKTEDIASDGRWSDSTKNKNRNALLPPFPLAIGSSAVMKITRRSSLEQCREVVGDASSRLSNANR